MGKTPKSSQFTEISGVHIIPSNIPQWESIMNEWGEKLLRAVEFTAQIVAWGLDLDPEVMKKLMEYGPHLLAPTGTKLHQGMKEGEVLAGYVILCIQFSF